MPFICNETVYLFGFKCTVIPRCLQGIGSRTLVVTKICGYSCPLYKMVWYIVGPPCPRVLHPWTWRAEHNF